MAINSVKQDENLVTAGKMKTLLRLFKYLLNYKGLIAAVLLVMAGSIAISIINPLMVERAINVHIANKDMESLTSLALLFLILNVILVLLVKLRMYLMSLMSNDVLVKIRQELFMHIQTLGFQFFDSRPTGKILARLIGDVNSLKNVLSNFVTTLLPEFVTLVAVVVIMFAKDYKLALAAAEGGASKIRISRRTVFYPVPFPQALADSPEKILQLKCVHPRRCFRYAYCTKLRSGRRNQRHLP